MQLINPSSRVRWLDALDRPDLSLDRAIRPMAMTYDEAAAIRELQFLPPRDKGIGSAINPEPAFGGRLPLQFAHGIVDGFRLTEGDSDGSNLQPRLYPE